MRINRTKSLFFIAALCLIIFAAARSQAQTQNWKEIERPKPYSSMKESEKLQFIKIRSDEILNKFGRINGDDISDIGIERIKGFVEIYAGRVKPTETTDTCNFGDDLKTVLLRGKKYSYGISQSFKNKLLNPEIGIYIAMIESEFCECIQSPTGALGMFQFVTATGESYGLQTNRGASPDNPDERCSPVKAATASASLFDNVLRTRRINGNYGRDANGILLAIAAYNGGENAIRRNIKEAEAISGNIPVTFWTLMKNPEKMTRQFQQENIDYVPKYLAAAIVGENPEVFGVSGVSALSK